MEFEAKLVCSKCKEPITSGESFGYIRFKIPGKEGYFFFHCRFRGRDCWEDYLKGQQT